MSLGLPQFGSRASDDALRGGLRVIQLTGFAVLAYSLLVGAYEWQKARTDEAGRQHARDEAARSLATVEQTRRALQKQPEALVAMASLESSPARASSDLRALLPPGVSIPSLKLDYGTDGTTHLDMAVVARSPESYDRFLSALSKSPLFSDLKPGAEVRPGLVRATVSATHRPHGVAR